MVTTRSADKRNNSTQDGPAQDGLVLRSKTIQSPSSTSSTPTINRKRAINHLPSPRPKRTRLGSKDAKVSDENDISDERLETAGRAERAPDSNKTDDASTDTLPQVEVIVPPLPASAQKEPTTNQSATEVVDDNTSTEIPSKGQVDSNPSTPKAITHKRFDSQEPEDILIADSSANNIGTDSSAYQEYQTAEEEIIDSDEAPDVATTRTPSKKLQKAGKTPRRKAKKVAKSETIPEDAAETTAESSVEALLATNATESAADITTTVPSVTQLPLSPPAASDVESQDHHETMATDTLSAPVELTTVSTTLATNNTSKEPPSTPQHTTPQLKEDLSLSTTTTTTTLPEEQPQKYNLEATTISNSSSTIPLPPLDINESITDIPAPRTTQDLQSQETSTRINTNSVPASSKIHFTYSSPSSSTQVLPSKSRTTLSSHRRALLDRRAQRSGGAFRFEASWAKKRRSFVV